MSDIKKPIKEALKGLIRDLRRMAIDEYKNAQSGISANIADLEGKDWEDIRPNPTIALRSAVQLDLFLGDIKQIEDAKSPNEKKKAASELLESYYSRSNYDTIKDIPAISNFMETYEADLRVMAGVKPEIPEPGTGRKRGG